MCLVVAYGAVYVVGDGVVGGLGRRISAWCDLVSAPHISVVRHVLACLPVFLVIEVRSLFPGFASHASFYCKLELSDLCSSVRVFESFPQGGVRFAVPVVVFSCALWVVLSVSLVLSCVLDSF